MTKHCVPECLIFDNHAGPCISEDDEDMRIFDDTEIEESLVQQSQEATKYGEKI